MREQKEYALITGASKGLGHSFARELAKRNINVLLTALPGENLEEFCDQLSTEYGIEANFLECDLTEKEDVLQLVDWVKENYPLNILINNAGIGGTSEFENTDITSIDNILLLDVRATVLLTHQLLPLLRFNKPGWILNVGSMASFSPIGYKTVYPASKAFVSSFSRGLHEELKDSGVFVSVVHPGPMTTNEDSKRRIKKQGKLGKMSVLSAEYTAAKTIYHLFKKKSFILVGKGNKLNWLLLKIVPTRIRLPIVTNIIKREFKKSKKSEPHYESIGHGSKQSARNKSSFRADKE